MMSSQLANEATVAMSATLMKEYPMNETTVLPLSGVVKSGWGRWIEISLEGRHLVVQGAAVRTSTFGAHYKF